MRLRGRVVVPGVADCALGGLEDVCVRIDACELGRLEEGIDESRDLGAGLWYLLALPRLVR